MVTPMELPGFANSGWDDIRVFKTDDVLTVRSNGAWVLTESSPALEVRGITTIEIAWTKGSADQAVFLPMKRCYDNDRIRELMERIVQPGEKLTAEEALRLWDEASLLSPPENYIRLLRGGYVPKEVRDKVPVPQYPGDAPPLERLRPEEAEARFTARGPAVWTKADPVETDKVWCARPDGLIEVMSRVRYWTDRYPVIREAWGATPVREPVFDKDAVWFPTDRGLYVFDRRAELLRGIPVGGVFFGSVKSLSIKGKLLQAEIDLGKGRARWSLDQATGKWSS